MAKLQFMRQKFLAHVYFGARVAPLARDYGLD